MNKFKLLALLFITLLTACNQQQQATSTPVPAQKEVKTPSCFKPLGISTTELKKNITAALLSYEQSADLQKSTLSDNDCGQEETITTDFATILIYSNKENQATAIAIEFNLIKPEIGKQTPESKAANLNNIFSAMQTVLSINGTTDFEEYETGKALLQTFFNTLDESNKNVHAEIWKDLYKDGVLYNVSIINNFTIVISAVRGPEPKQES
ncbi:hypothetical protein [Neisseria montereyensis]|uniref:Lipoprotein n=1 Tax=Neisseria montereyensis TaxID=2973938 RepID=A0ABT2FAC2_9NEIS|nr:hypothetical protein [Neisseria montereyensis]MCS4533093.1 hypothetical protein [Neisseria montereyensis]